MTVLKISSCTHLHFEQESYSITMFIKSTLSFIIILLMIKHVMFDFVIEVVRNKTNFRLSYSYY